LTAVEIAGLFVAAFSAGAINAVAGGGSLVSFPALIIAGYPAKTANVTNTVALWPGYFGGSLAYRPELARQRRRIALLLAPSVAGAIVGSAVLLTTSENAFEAIVPFLIVFACSLLLFQDRLSEFARRHRLHTTDGESVPLALHAVTFAAAVYGAYFGAGLGIILLAFLIIMVPDDIQHSNALKGMLSLLINAVAVVYFALFGPVEWGPAAVMAGGALAGGYLGVGIARRLGPQWLRLAVITYGLVAAVALFIDLFV
jgi:uncharacterized membrane protein YfcA